MNISSAPIEGIKVIQLKVFKDSRGFFVERFHMKNFKDAGLPTHFVQDNHSCSLPKVLRGLHYQVNPDQGKLVGVTRGKIWDVAVDIRKNSTSYGKHFGIELSADNGTLLWIPAGFAHGFCVLGNEPADVMYKTDSHYSPQGEGGILWSDPDLAISWPIKDPIVSARDEKLPSFASFSNSGSPSF